MPGALLLLFLAMPGMIFYLLPISSQAPGIALALPLMAIILAKQRQSIPYQSIRHIAYIDGFIILHFLVAAVIQPVDATRFAGSLVLLTAVLTIALSIAPVLFDNINKSTLNAIFWGLIFCGVLGILGFQFSTSNATGKPVFPYSEPSIFSLSLSPIFMFAYATSKGRSRAIYACAALGVALLLQSFTLLVSIALIMGLCLPLRWTFVLAAAATLVIVLGADEQIDYYAKRIDFSEDNQNLTALVYMQGWQMIFEAWENSMGWGSGFQQLGVNSTSVEAAEIIHTISGGGSLNLRDGSFVLVKLIADFGIFGVVAVCLYLKTAISSIKELRKMAVGAIEIPPGRMLAHSVLLTFFVEIFMRGAGYLTGTGALFIAAISYLHRTKPHTAQTRNFRKSCE